ncbi:LuxR C-terminal-related transcriptional regulator [Egicoccus sp. AB-alg6-2]|uniref:LuxR C-terminal-related transcriptional regulator n=1 Tax=Egicoccus sp. AB-alg6-2 TaxID=3242692 RepID=UPI00359D397B
MAYEQRAEIVVVDGHAVVCEGIRGMIHGREGLWVSGRAGSVAEAVTLVPALQPQIVLVGLRLPDGDASDLIRQLRRVAPRVKSVVFSPVADDESFFSSVVAGAVGFVTDDITSEGLVRALAKVAAGESLVTPAAIEDLRRKMRRAPRPNALAASLTGQEARIMSMVVEGATNGEIARELSLAEKTVRNYMSSILAKAGVRNRTELTAAVVRSAAAAPPRDVHIIRLPDDARVG